MTSTHEKVEDVLEKAKGFSRSEDGTIVIFPTVESETAEGKPIYWKIKVQLLHKEKPAKVEDDYFTLGFSLDLDHSAVITVDSWQDGGIIKAAVPTHVRCGKNKGKKNETNVLSQAIRDAYGRYTKQVKKAGRKINFILPMLPKKYTDVESSKLADKILDFTKITAQVKINGIRMICYLDDTGEVVMYSRTGSLFTGLDNIRSDVKKLLSTDTAIGIYLDGEIYKHNRDLNWISGQARKKKMDEELDYFVFDCFMPDDMEIMSKQRQELLDDVFSSVKDEIKHVIRVKNEKVNSLIELQELGKKYVSNGYEGIIARYDDGLYEPSVNSYHTPYIFKIKPIDDEEFQVVGYTSGTKGKDVGAIVWICETKKGDKFNVVPKGITLEKRKKMFTFLNSTPTAVKKIIGKPLTVQFQEYSAKTGKPLRAKALQFRTYEGDDFDVNTLFTDL